MRHPVVDALADLHIFQRRAHQENFLSELAQ
jgi:hypothetical protein